MNLKNVAKNKVDIISVATIIIYAYLINTISGNIGVLVIDTFGFFDTGFSILHGKLPIRDYWIFSGFLVDYLEALFFYIFGNNWSSHVLHASFFNVIVSLFFYFFFNKVGLEKKLSLFYTLCFATLCYPVSGTPFAYLHAYIFSIISLKIFYFAALNQSNKYWFLLPFVGMLAFLSMQTPSAYIILLIAFLSIFYFFKKKKIDNLKFLSLGVFFSILIVILFLFFSKIKFESFFYQYFLFPFSIGEGRIMSDASSYVSLKDQLNFKKIFGDFKFIHIFFLPLIFISIYNLKKNLNKFILLNIVFVSATALFIFNQLLTANQIYIFSLVPLLAAILHLNIVNLNFPKYIGFIIIIAVLFATFKFHYRYNIDRKFHDLEKTSKIQAIDASVIHKNLKGLKWVSKQFPDPKDEIKMIKRAIEIIEKDKRRKMLITHYSFISTILDEDLNLLNRWYLWDNNTHPTENHKYFSFYKNMVNKKLENEKIEVIYLLGRKMKFEKFKINFTEVCFESKIIINKKFSAHKIIKCK